MKTSETNAAELARLMVGRDVLLRVEKPDAKPGEPVLSVRNLSVHGTRGGAAVDGVSFEVRAGEIVGIAGVEGNGQTELIEALAGPRRPVARLGRGHARGAGRSRRARRARRRELRHRPHSRGPPPARPAARLRPRRERDSRRALSPAAGRTSAASLLDRAAIRARGRTRSSTTSTCARRIPTLPARALSGGNQQKLIIGREFELPPKLLLVSQPTRGVDIGAIEFIHRKLVELRDAGCAVLLVSAELEEVTALSDRLLVIHDGRIVGEVDPKAATIEEIGLLMTGGEQPRAR